MYVDGETALHIHSFEENGVRKTAFAVNNTSGKDSWRAFEVAEGSNYASTKCWGDWDFSDASVDWGVDGWTGTISVGTLNIYVTKGIITDVRYRPAT